MRQIVVVLIALVSVVSCSTRKDRAVNRAYHQTTTKFNVLFNGEEAIADGIEAEIESHQYFPRTQPGGNDGAIDYQCFAPRLPDGLDDPIHPTRFALQL